MNIFLTKLFFLSGCIILFSLFSNPIFGQINLIKDVNTITTIYNPSNPSNFQKLGSTFFFKAEAESQGFELWKSNGTVTGTQLIKDIAINGSSNPSNFIAYNGEMYFTATYDYQTGDEIWKTDGTTAGTQLVISSSLINASTPKNLIVYNGFIYFTAYSSAAGGQIQLWRTNGTTTGTIMVKAMYIGSSNPVAENMTIMNGSLFYRAGSNGMANRLWRTNGTSSGTIELASCFTTSLVASGTELFFAGDLNSDIELWKTDGTLAGTQIVKNISSSQSSYPESFCMLNGILFFSASDNVNGIELWKSDGTFNGTVMVKDIHPQNSMASQIYQITSYGNAVYFRANDGTNGAEIWKSDGTFNGTVMLKNIFTGASSSNPENFKVVNNNLYFTANSTGIGIELWLTDGSSNGTVLVKDIFTGSQNSYPSNLFDFNGVLIFNAQNANNNFEIWKSNGTSSGTQLIKDIYSDSPSSDIQKLTLHNNKIIFVAKNGSTKNMWSTNGTTAGTNLITPLGNYFSSVEADIAILNNFIIYNGGTSNNRELYKTDGTTSGSQLIKNINPANTTFGSNPHFFKKSGNLVFFVAYNNTSGKELWRTDGTLAGTVLVKDIGFGSQDGNVNNLTDLNGTLYFSASSGSLEQIWKSDGTTSGTVPIINFSGSNNEINSIFTYNNEVYFDYWSNLEGNCLKKVNGTGTGVIHVLTFPPATIGSAIYAIENPIVMNGILYFSTVFPFNGNVLWRSDGTTAGTYGVSANYNSSPCTQITEIEEFQGNLFFAGKTANSGIELWKSDGTPAGTSLLKDIVIGAQSGDPKNLKVVNGTLYFTATNGSDGYEFWKTNGTSNGTAMFEQLELGPNSSVPKLIGNFNNKLIYDAYLSSIGRELFSYTESQNITVNTCNSYLWTQTGINYTTSGTYYDTLISSTGSDSIVTLNLNLLADTLIDVQIACDSFTWINGITYYNSNNTATYMLTNVYGCDSIILLNLTINNSSPIFIDNQIACDSFTWINGITYYNSNNTATYMLTNVYGCDSIILLNLTINNSSPIFIDNQIACDSLLWIDGNTYYSSNNSATHILPNVLGCDSIITLNLTILSPTFNTEVITACDSFTWTNGVTYFSNNNTAFVTLVNAAGCDSFIFLNLTINSPNSATDVVFACDSLTWIDGVTYYNSTTAPTYFLTNSMGCDSVVNLDLTLIPSLPTNITTFSLPSDTSLCNGQIAITTTGNAPFTLDISNGAIVENSNGYKLVDSLCPGYLNLFVTDNCGDTLTQTIVIPIDSNYVFNNPYVDSIAVDSLGSTIQNCTIYYNSIDTAFIESLFMTGNIVNIVWNIIDSTGSNYDTTTFVPNAGNGVYWVQLSVFCPQESNNEGYFTVTQAIYIENGTFSSAHLSENLNDRMKIYPNPTQSDFTIESTIQLNSIILFDAAGRKVIEQNIMSNSTNLSLSIFENGIYFLEIQTPFGSILKRIIKQ